MRCNPWMLLLVVTCGIPAPGQTGPRAWTELPLTGEIQTSQKIPNCPTGWQAVDDAEGACPRNARHTLVAVAVYDGPPSQCADLVPDAVQDIKARKRRISTWHLASASSEGTWIRCNYAQTRLGLCRQLPLTAKEVRVTASLENPNPPEVLRVEYQE